MTFPTVQARYVRMYGTQRATQYGYSFYKFQVYNVPACGGSTERYTVNSINPALVLDNLLGLTWTRTIKTDTATGSQFTGVDAAAYRTGIKMRIPRQSEALDISGNNNASCAFSGAWKTWTSILDPNDAGETAIVGFDGSVSEKVTNNWPGETLCTVGTSAAQPPVIQGQPQPTTAAVGQSAIFTVAAIGTPTPDYQWLENNAAIPGATSATYITPPVASTDNGALFSVLVANETRTLTSNTALLTIGTAPVPPTNPTPPTNPGTYNSGAGDVIAIHAGGSAVDSFLADGYVVGGGTTASNNTILVGGIANAARQALYQTERAGIFTYTIPNLTKLGAYTVRLHFAEFWATAKGQRVFNVALNGIAVLSNFDIIASAGVPNIANVQTVTGTADPNGNLVIDFLSGPANQPKVDGIEVVAATSTLTPAPVSADVVAIDAGGTPVAQFLADADFVGGGTGATNNPINTAGVLNAAPQKVYQSERNGTLTYTLPNLTANATYTVRLHFSEFWATSKGQRVFNVAINNTLVLSNFDILAVVAPNTALVKDFTATAVGGKIAISFTNGSANQPKVNGIEILAIAAAIPPNPVTPPAATPPSITTQPVNRTVTIGTSATFSVTASGGPPLTYQWSKNGTTLSGATSATYITPGTTAPDNNSIYAQFWHAHSVGALAYGFPYDDANNFSSTIQSSSTQHMAFGIGW